MYPREILHRVQQVRTKSGFSSWGVQMTPSLGWCPSINIKKTLQAKDPRFPMSPTRLVPEDPENPGQSNMLMDLMILCIITIAWFDLMITMHQHESVCVAHVFLYRSKETGGNYNWNLMNKYCVFLKMILCVITYYYVLICISMYYCVDPMKQGGNYIEI